MASLENHSLRPMQRIRRKPPPQFGVSERYPPPDPTDPLASLSVLRSRASIQNVYGQYELYPNFTSSFGIHSSPLPSAGYPLKDPHYRRRSQSVDIPHVLAPRLSQSYSIPTPINHRERNFSQPSSIVRLFRVSKKTSLASVRSEWKKRREDTSQSPPSSYSYTHALSTSHSLSSELSFVNVSIPSTPTHTNPEPISSSYLVSARLTPSFSTHKNPTSVPLFISDDSASLASISYQVSIASNLSVVSESGVRIRFGDIFTRRKTIFLFVRPFWCSEYIGTLLDVEQRLRKAGLGLCIIGNGSHTMAAKYRKLFHLPTSYQVYTDPTMDLHKALGIQTVDEHAVEQGRKRKVDFHGLASAVLRALRVGMPLWEKGEHLGAEFVLGPGGQCSFAHRMRTISDHTPIIDIIRAIGASGSCTTSISERTEVEFPTDSDRDSESSIPFQMKSFRCALGPEPNT